MSFPGDTYAPPGVYTQTFFDNPLQGISASLRIPLLLGTGSESLFQDALEVVRGSSSSSDQRVVDEDLSGRAVVSVSESGEVTLGAFNGSLKRVQVKNFPIVNGNGTGTTATNSSKIRVTIAGNPVVVLAIDGAKGILTLSTAPKLGEETLATYFFNRTDTLVTDTLSDQVTSDAPEIYGTADQNYDITTDVNDTLEFTVDSEDAVTVTLSESPTGGWTAAQIAAFINSDASGTSLSATTAEDSQGRTVLYLTADRDIVVGSGSANTTLGLTTGTDTARNKTFFTFQGPIVDGTNGGITSTDPADVTVKVDGTQVIPESLDGASRTFTLGFAPEPGAVVTCQYYFNSWQDTFDHLQHRNITAITQAGLTPDRKDYTSGTDFILKDDKILWGTASLVESGVHTSGATYFNDTQVSTTLVDARQYLAECAAYVDTSVNPPLEDRKTFTLPLVATTGNGRNSLIDSDTFTDVANGRVGLPTNRPDLVLVYWGYSLSDAVERGAVEVTKVDSDNSRVTLASAVPVGASVYATFYYNTIQDQEYTLTVDTEGGSGVGVYSVANEDGDSLYTALFSSKSAGLATIQIQFPSGAESTADTRFETPFDATSYVGPVEEDVTVTFATQNATLGSYTVPGAGPYYIAPGASDNFDIIVDGATLTGGHVDLSDPIGSGSGFFAQMVGNEIEYSAASGGTSFVVDSTNNTIDLMVDGVLLNAIALDDSTSITASFTNVINQVAFGVYGATASSGGAATIVIPNGSYASGTDDYYIGWEVVVTGGLGAAATIRTVTDYVASTKTLTLDGGTYDGTSVFSLYNPDNAPYMTGATRFLSAVTITAGEYDELQISVTGSTTGQTTLDCAGGDAIVAGTYTTATALAAAVQTAIDAAISTAAAACVITVGVDTSGRLTFSLIPDPTDTEGAYLEFVAQTAGEDFALLAGLDTDAAAQSGQAKLFAGPIARVYSLGASPYLTDRIILRNRLIPGQTGSMDGEFIKGFCQLEVLGGTGAEQAGLVAKDTADAGIRGTMMEPTIFGEVGISGGQVPTTTYGDARDGQPVVTFYADGGTTPQNNVFKMTFEGTPITVEFTDASGVAIASGSSADVPLGPVGSANTVLGQISAAMTAAGLSAAPVQEGAGIRLRGDLTTAATSIVLGTGSANEILGFTDGDSVERETLSVDTLVSALMAHTNTTLSDSIFTWAGASGYFAFAALAKRVTDSANAQYLYLQSQGNAGAGTTSSIAIDEAATDSTTLPGTGLGISDGDGGSGEDAVDGFYVTSSDTVNGSGSAGTSVFNSGTGQDGYVGQTYRDSVTGLTFSVLAREGGSSYPAGQTFTITCRSLATTDSNLPTNVIPGVELIVSNTSGITAGDTAVVSTFDSSGNSPDVGDLYYVSYNYSKADFSTSLYTKMAAIEAAFGGLSPENPATLASYLALLNGAVILAIRQVQADTDSDSDGVNDEASVAAFMSAIDSVAGALPGGAYPDTLIALKGGSDTLNQYLAQQADIQSSLRYRAERTVIAGCSAGTEPRAAGDQAEAVARYRFRLVYPDMYNITLSTATAENEEFLVDGTFMAAALAGNRASPRVDVATPWTGARILGIDSVARVLDAVQENQVAVRGVTVITQERSVIKVRQGFTTDMANNLTKLPTIITIADEVQRQSRSTLDRFSGIKNLDGVTGQIETQLNSTLRQLNKAQIIAAYTPSTAQSSPDNPTTAEVESSYAPVFPLLYLLLTFQMRSSL